MPLQPQQIEDEIRVEIGEKYDGSISSLHWNSETIMKVVNRGTNHLIDLFLTNRCWQLITGLQKEVKYKLTGVRSYNVYDIIGSTDYRNFISAGLGNDEVARIKFTVVSIEEFEKITRGEYNVSSSHPYLCFYSYALNTNEAFPNVYIHPHTLTNYLYFRYLRKATVLTAQGTQYWDLPDICLNILVFWCAMRLWSADRNTFMYQLMKVEYEEEKKKLLETYSEPVLYDTDEQPIK